MVTPTIAPQVEHSETSSSTSRRSGLPTWMPLAGLVFLLVVVTYRALRPVGDPDTWWHLRLGQLFRDGWSLADPGQLTPFASQPWVPTQWLPEVIASLFQEWFGLPGVVWLAGMAVLTVMLVIYRNCRLDSDILPAAVATALAFVGMLASLTPRPHLVTYVLLAVTVGSWMATVRDLRPRWWLIALTWVWACSHGMWFSGVAVGIAVTTGLILDRRVTLRRAGQLGAVPLLSLLAAALTPVGPALLRAPFAVGDVTSYISEWAPPSFDGFGPPLVTAGMGALVILTWARQGRVPWTNLGLLLLAGGWTLLSVRTVALGALMMAPLLAGALQSWLSANRGSVCTRAEKATLSATLAACLASLALLAPVMADSPARVPTALSDELQRLPRGTTILNSYGIGGWLHWRHPELTPTADGLTEAYGADYIGRYFDATEARQGWQWAVDATGARHALLHKDEPLSTALQERLGWRMVGSDEGYLLLRAPAIVGRKAASVP